MNMNRFMYIAMIALLLLLGGCDKDSPTDNTLSLEEKLQSALDAERQSKNLMGISAAVIIPGKSNWLGVSGISTTSQEIESDMLFGIGSITKTYTAVLILQLIEEGLLDLDDQLDQWLPNFANIDSTTTIRQLLNHTSGIFNFTDNPASGAFEDISSSPKTALYSAAWTSGGIIATAEEAALFFQALFTEVYLNQDSIGEMLTFHPLSQSFWTGYGLGIQRMEALGREFWGHGGSIPGYASFVLTVMMKMLLLLF